MDGPLADARRDLGCLRSVASTPRRIAVLGMHRSGTSSVTRVVNLLGVPLCARHDLMGGPGNPDGFWESATVARFNDRLLAELGGTWRNPPTSSACFERPSLTDVLDDATEAFYSVHGAEWVWKDPRTCLTFPFWRSALGPMTMLLVLRGPWGVAHSLARRHSQMPLRYGIALWERYTRSMLRFAEGQAVVFVQFEDLLSEPSDTVERMCADFSAVGVPLEVSNVGSAASSIRGAARAPEEPMLTRSQLRLLDACRTLAGGHSVFQCPPLGSETRGLQHVFSPSQYRYSVGRAWRYAYLRSGTSRGKAVQR